MTNVNLFVVPPASPHTIVAAVPYLAGDLESNGHRARIVDLNAALSRSCAPSSVLRRLTSPIRQPGDVAEVAQAERQLEELLELTLGSPDPTIDATWDDIAQRAAAIPTKAIDPMLGAIERHCEKHPGLIGFSCLSQDQLAVALRLARGVKDCDPTATVIVGGPMMLTSSKYFPDEPPLDAFDYIVTNNGAAAFGQLLRSLEEAESSSSDEIIHAGQSVVAVGRKSIGLPIGQPASPLFPPELLDGLLAPRPVLPIFSAQGCSYGKCNFCSSQRSVTPYRPTKMSWIVAEMDRLHAECGASDFDIVDNNFDPRRMGSLMRALLEGERQYRWKATARFYDEFDAPFLGRAVEAGCGLLCLGLESYDDDGLAAMEKGYATDTIDRVLAAAHEVGLPVHLYAIVGHPSETERAHRATLGYLRDHQEFYASTYLQVYDANLSSGVFVSSVSDDSAMTASVTALADELATDLSAFDLHIDEGGVLVRRKGHPRSEELFFLALADASRG